jgi:RNA polymerase sigma-70 factor (ECF subfamily)
MWVYWDYLNALAQREIGHDLRAKGDPADIVQETFLDAYRDRSKYQGSTEAEYRAWLRAILRNNARTFRRRYRDAAMRGVTREISLAEIGADLEGRFAVESQMGFEAASQDMIRREEIQRLRGAIGLLPARERAALLSKLWQGKSFREIGEELGCSAPNVFKLCRHAIDTLRSRLGDN